MEEANNDNSKSKYLRRLIEIKEDQKDTKSALEYSDKLIELDEFNISYVLSRTNIFIDIKDKLIHLKGLLEKFKYSISLRNHLCRIALTYLENNDEKLITFKEIHKLIEESLFQDNSLDNNAWKLKYDTIESEHQSNHGKKECNENITALLDRISSINPTHDTYLNIYSDFSCSSHTKKDITTCIETLSNVYKTSSKNKKRNILKYLTKLHLSLFETEYDDDTPETMRRFIEEYQEDEDISKIAPFIIFKARYEIGCNKNSNTAIALAKEAMDSPWKNNHIESITNILLIDNDNIPLVEEFIENLPRDTSDVLILKIKSDISILKGDYKASIQLLEEAYKEGWDFSDYT